MGLRALLPDAAVFVAPHVFAAFVGEVAAASVVGGSVDARIAGGNHALQFYVKARGGGDDIGLFHDVCLCLIDKMMMRCCWAVRSANDDLLAVDDVEALLCLLYAASAQVVGFHLVLLIRVDALDDRTLVEHHRRSENIACKRTSACLVNAAHTSVLRTEAAVKSGQVRRFFFQQSQLSLVFRG